MVALRQYFVYCETRLLHYRASVLELVGNFYCCLLQCAVQTVCLLRSRTFSVVCTFPLSRRIENFTRPLHDTKIGFGHRGIRIGWAAKFRILCAQGN